jgi:hypothetical protein
MDYMIHPVMMGGLVKEVADDQVKVHLHGRLGVITVPKKLIITNELTPSLLGGTIIEVNDTAAKVEIMEHMGTIAVPRRWLFTDVALETGQQVEFYMSPMRVIGKRDIPQESI